MQKPQDGSFAQSPFAFSWKAFFVAFSLTALVLTLKYREVYFGRPIYEQDDFAANALSIRNAGEFRETLGNYSRWHFRHPGPAFFYFAAAGDLVFHRLLKICPAEHNAHLYASMLVQAAFWAAVFGLLASYRFTARSLCLVWIAGWIHFYLTGHAFVSNWPPHVLLLPFVCYAVACASVAAGRVGHLWVLLPTGVLLVHGHVAQPLPVGLLALGAISGAAVCWRRDGRLEWPHGRYKGAWWAVTLGATALLLLPMAVDLARWPDSNVNAILAYMSRNRHDSKTFAQALDYLLQFTRYWGFHDEPEKPLFGTVLSHAYPFMAWCLVLTLAVRFALQRNRLSETSSRRMVLALTGIFFVALVSALLWGVKMSGAMFAFNGFYFYGVYFLPLCVVCLAWSELKVKRLSILNLISMAGAVAVPLFFKPLPVLSDQTPGTAIKEGIEGLVRAGKIDLSQPYLLSFFPQCASAVTVLNTLDRMGAKIFVPDSAEWQTGRQFRWVDSRRFERPMGILQISPGAPGRTGEFPLYDGGRLTIESATVDPGAFPLAIDFNGTAGVGVSGMASDGIGAPWSIDTLADILVRTRPTDSDIRATFTWAGLQGPRNSQPRRVILRIPGMSDQAFAVAELRQDTVVIPKATWNECVERAGLVPLHLVFLDPISPKECGLNDDSRPLSVSLRGLVFERVQ